MAMLLPGEVQAAIIESLVAVDSDARFHQNELCLTCKKAISKSKIIKVSRDSEIRTKLAKHIDRTQVFAETIDHHQNLESLSESLRGGCHLCSLFSAGIQTEIEQSRSGSLASMSTLFSRVSTSSISRKISALEVACSTFRENGWMRLCKRNLDGTEDVNGPTICLDPIINRDWPEHNPKYVDFKTSPDALFHPTLSTSSPTSFRWAKSQLDHCLSHHAVCSSAYKSTSHAPRRLLDLSQVGSSGTMRLVVVNRSKDIRPQYTTLSHRWDNEPIIRLLRNNEAKLRESFPVEDLPHTFQHAAMVTLRLGLGYIWIDSLCIIRDSPIDWERGVKDIVDQPKSRFHNLAPLDPEKVDLSAPNRTPILFHKYWSGILAMYTATDLTQASDRLVAINGIISKVQKSTRFTPLAGLWKDLLPAELLWKVNKPSYLPSAKEHRAPSWSWASVDSGITHQFVELFENTHKFSWEVDVLEAEATNSRLAF